MAYGFVYVIGHELMDGVYKIGMTGQTPLRRTDELSSGTAIPSPFDLLFYIEVDEPAEVERAMHEVFADFRISENREFFNADLTSIYKEFENFKNEAGAPLALTSVGEGYLLSDADRIRALQESSARFMARINPQTSEAEEMAVEDRPEEQVGGA